MKKITKMLLVLICILCFSILSSSSSKAKRNDDLINNIVKKMGGKVKETGIRASFEVYAIEKGKLIIDQKKSETLSVKLMSNLLEDGSQAPEVTVVKDDKSYTLEFNKNNLNGYIESRIYDNHNIITLDIKVIGFEQDFKKLKSNITEVFTDVIKKETGLKASEIKFNYYLTAKLEVDNIDMYYSLLLKILKEYGVSDINSINIERGYSLSANSRLYERVKSGGRWIDINIALSKYSSGNYITIGTPTIYAQY